jgi:hypothetical protein
MDDFTINPSKLPKKLEIEIPPRVMEYLEKKSAASGRSIDELVLEVIDKGLGEY